MKLAIWSGSHIGARDTTARVDNFSHAAVATWSNVKLVSPSVEDGERENKSKRGASGGEISKMLLSFCSFQVYDIII